MGSKGGDYLGWGKVVNMKTSTGFILGLFIAVLAFGAGLFGGVAIDRLAFAKIWPLAMPVTGNTASTDFPILKEAYNLIQKEYVDRTAVQQQKLEYGAVSGMVDSLGDTGHSRFLTPQMVKQERDFTSGSFEGIGAEVQAKDGQTVIVSPFDQSPAQKAGLRAGDIILKVNGEDVSGQPISTVTSKILGPAGTDVTLTVQRPSTGVIKDYKITRARITLQNVTWAPIPGTKYVDLRIEAFSSGVTDDLKKALKDIQSQGYQGIILDLRDNPGGLLQECIDTTSQFLKDGDVLEVKDASGKISKMSVRSGGVATSLPMTVLINQGTASAAEIVSGALQDAGRAQLVGQTTFGTGTVLNEFNLSDGSALLLATQEWLTPKGRVIWHNGIKPDQAVALDQNATPVVPNTLKSMTAGDVQKSSDAQFLKALEALQNQK
jgi:carboxyl-terminal processing protease